MNAIRQLEAVRTHDRPRSDHGAERAILGAAMIDADAFARVECVLTAADFDHPRHAFVFDALAGLSAAQTPIGQITVAAELERRGQLDAAGGSAYIDELANACSSASGIDAHARIVADHAFVRRLGAAGEQIAMKARDPKTTPEYFAEFASARVFEATERRTTSEPTQIGPSVETALTEYAQRVETKSTPGMSTGLSELDAMISGGGLIPGRSYLFAGQPGAGKTGLVTGIVQAIAATGKPALAFVLEMSRAEMTSRMICRQGRIDTRRWDAVALTDEEQERLEPACATIFGLPLFIDDSAGTTVMDIRAKARRLQRRLDASGQRLHVLVVDYLQLVSVPNITDDNREQQIAFVSRGLKTIAKDLNVAVIAISSLNQNGAKRQDKRPELGDMRGSGAIAFDADLVAAVYRDELVNRDSDDKGIAEVIILKQRNGPTGTVRLKFDAPCVRFETLQGEAWS